MWWTGLASSRQAGLPPTEAETAQF